MPFPAWLGGRTFRVSPQFDSVAQPQGDGLAITGCFFRVVSTNPVGAAQASAGATHAEESVPAGETLLRLLLPLNDQV